MSRLLVVAVAVAALAFIVAPGTGRSRPPAAGPLVAKPLAPDKPLLPNNTPYLGRGFVGASFYDVEFDVEEGLRVFAYAGSANGLLASRDSGKTWQRSGGLGNTQTMSVGSVGVDPANRKHVVAGTGDPTMACGGRSSIGVFESRDGGATIRRLGANEFHGQAITGVSVRRNSILVSTVDATEPNLCYSRAGTGEAGVFRWKSGQFRWAKILDGQVTSLGHDPLDSDRVVASVFRQGLFQSLNRGLTWTQIGNLPFSSTGRYSFSFLPGGVGISRLAVSVENANTNGLFGLYEQRADTLFDAWPLPAPPSGLSQACVCRYGSFFGKLGANYYFAGTDIWRSSGIDQPWVNLSRTGNDVVGKLPITWYGIDRIGSTLIAFGDYGAYSTTTGATWRPTLEHRLRGMKTRSVAPSPTGANSGLIGAGNAGIVQFSGGKLKVVDGGPAGGIVFDPNRATNVFSCFRHLCERSIDGGRTWTLAESFPADAFVVPQEPPFVFDPDAPNTVYVAHRGIYKSADGGETWLGAGNVVDTTAPDITGLHQVTALAIPGVDGALLAGTSEGRLVLSNLDFPWSITPLGTNLPRRPITSIVVDPSDPSGDTMYVAMAGLNVDTPGKRGHVFTSTNGGKTFADITGNLGDRQVYDLEFDDAGDRLFAATSDGAWHRGLSGGLWGFIGGFDDETPVLKIGMRSVDSRLWLATYSQGVYEVNLP